MQSKDFTNQNSVQEEGEPLSSIDTSLVEYNLGLSYEERVLQHEQALAMYFELERAGREMRKQLEFDGQSK